MIDDDVELDEGRCPVCGQFDGLRRRRCTAIGCDDGYFDEAEYDAINFAPGEVLTECEECLGTALVRWCSKCGADLTGK